MASAMAAAADTATAEDTDPFAWLEQVDSPRAMEWVKPRTPRPPPCSSTIRVTTRVFQGSTGHRRGQGPNSRAIDHRRADSQLLAGRRARARDVAANEPTSYRNAAPAWAPVLDLDALSKAEKANWFWAGADCEEPGERDCMLGLSDGGEDAVSLREFDLARRICQRRLHAAPWQAGCGLAGPRHPAGGAGVDTRRDDALGISIRRQAHPPRPAAVAAVEVFRGSADDVGVSPISLSDGAGHRVDFIQRAVSIFECEYHVVGRPRAGEAGSATEGKAAGARRRTLDRQP